MSDDKLTRLVDELMEYLPAATRNQALAANGGPVGPGTLKQFKAVIAQVFQLGRHIGYDEAKQTFFRDPDAGTCTPLIWHEGKHYWQEHDGMPRHQHSLNGALTIAPNDTRLHFSGGVPFDA